jgi:large subunit ribosomal protein L29
VKQSEITELPDNELMERLDNEKDYLSRLRLNHAITSLDNPNKIGVARRNIARLITEVNRRNKKSKTASEKS